MAAEPEFVFEVRETEFDERVVRASADRPVVVDFWAPWCAPCRMLSPVLEKVVASFGGTVVLAEVNVDEAPGLARQYGIRGIPAVKVFRQGKVVAEFVGARSEHDVREMLSRLVPSEADVWLNLADNYIRAGRADRAEPLYREALSKRPDHPGALLGLALIAMEKGDHEAARDAASRVEPGAAEYEEAERILVRLDFARDCAERGGKESAERFFADKPDDPDAAYALASCLAAEGDYAGALDHFMRIVGRDKGYRNGAAKDAMVRTFTIVGKRSALADEYRSRLARALY